MSDPQLSQADLARIVQENRAAAKQRIEQSRPALDRAPDQPVGSGGGAGAENGANASANADASKPSAFQRKKRAIDLTYCEYNLSTMKDTKGGFLYEEQSLPDSKKQKHEDKQVTYDPPIDLIMSNNPQCETCNSIDIDPHYLQHFKVCVCRSCKDKHPEKYSLLTKTEAREDYLLTDSELRDTTALPNWERPNPHKSTYSKMLLYLRQQVEAFAWKKWGSPEELDAEYQRREDEKKGRKEKKFKAKMSELRRKTRTSTWTRKVDDEHAHEFGESVHDPAKDEYTQICRTCGFVSTYEAF
ncbi:XPA protein C-terminus-domain-containing protein [Fimicolochytrium jonesii]|uniref:XPA protein C-terminus-domain-containing protein n=1 Tax=Fimicolochytrium jonesii TaxID=1396493 RepID=UPI0022FDD08F|nr:XPA protein C-terminus-domain-containing protein [Fimicolochytrium jonesii]KAI8822445.1 XPA protein C-terminus-domain-containing protein [Fimicolochytrium jonesii]